MTDCPCCGTKPCSCGLCEVCGLGSINYNGKCKTCVALAAARRKALEEAAKMIEEAVLPNKDMRLHLAIVIRDMIDKEPK